MKKWMTIVPITVFATALLASCGSGMDGTYVPKNEAAKQSNFAKFEFKRKTVKVYVGVRGMTLPMAYEYSYSVDGTTVSFETGVPGIPGMEGIVELTYDSDKQELALLKGFMGGAMDKFAPVWCNEKTCEQDDPPPPIIPDSISLNKTSLLFKKAGAREQLIATVFPDEVSEEDKKVSWLSSNEAVAKVDTSGLVTAVANGTAVISVQTLNGLSVDCSVQVKIPPVLEPTPAQLNDLLNKIANSDDNATDKIRNLLGNHLRVEGAANISNVQQLITDVSIGNRYKVTDVNRDENGKIVSISVKKH